MHHWDTARKTNADKSVGTGVDSTSAKVQDFIKPCCKSPLETMPREQPQLKATLVTASHHELTINYHSTKLTKPAFSAK